MLPHFYRFPVMWDKSHMETLPERVTACLLASGKNRKKASLEAKLSETYARDLIENNPKSPGMDHLRRFAAVVGTTAEYLLYGTDAPHTIVTANGLAPTLVGLFERMKAPVQKRFVSLAADIVGADIPDDELSEPSDRAGIVGQGAIENASDADGIKPAARGQG